MVEFILILPLFLLLLFSLIQFAIVVYAQCVLTGAAQNTEIIECWRKRDDANSGGSCLLPEG